MDRGDVLELESFKRKSAFVCHAEPRLVSSRLPAAQKNWILPEAVLLLLSIAVTTLSVITTFPSALFTRSLGASSAVFGRWAERGGKRARRSAVGARPTAREYERNSIVHNETKGSEEEWTRHDATYGKVYREKGRRKKDKKKKNETRMKIRIKIRRKSGRKYGRTHIANRSNRSLLYYRLYNARRNTDDA